MPGLPKIARSLVSLRRRLGPGLAFFGILLAWIALKTWIDFGAEFPALHLYCKWDCGWYESIARQGYVSPIPPLFQNSEASNVAFFPAYPLAGRIVALLLGIRLKEALPLASILFALAFSFALARAMRNEPAFRRRLRLFLLVCYPASLYLFVSYSESLYLAALFWVASLVLEEPHGAREEASALRLLALFGCGYVAGATRLTGFVIPAALFAGALLWRLVEWKRRKASSKSVALEGDELPETAFPLAGALVGSASFFAFCASRFGHWNLYFWQLRVGWYKEFSPLKALAILLRPYAGIDFKPEHMLEDTRRISWIVGAGVLAATVLASLGAVQTAREALRTGARREFLRSFLIWGAAAHLFIVLCGDVGPWDYWGNGMRYSMPSAYVLIAFGSPKWVPAWLTGNPSIRKAALALTLLAALYFFRLEWDLLSRFIRNQWVS